jgi:CheY-like chemotaxis protein
VVLIEDSALLRQSLSSALQELAGAEVLGSAADESSALELLGRQRPDLAIVDLQLREGSGLSVLRAIFRSPQRELHLARMGVLADVGQRLLGAAEQREGALRADVPIVRLLPGTGPAHAGRVLRVIRDESRPTGGSPAGPRRTPYLGSGSSPRRRPGSF